MLGLATHEPHFTIIREEFKPNQPRACDLCGQMGHQMEDCVGAPKDESAPPPPPGVEPVRRVAGDGSCMYLLSTPLSEAIACLLA